MSSFTTPLVCHYTGVMTTLSGNKLYALDEEFSYAVGSLDDPSFVVTVPKGFITDFASIPAPLNKWIKPEGPWAKACVLHDYLFTTSFEKTTAVPNAILYEALIVSGMSRFVAFIFWASVSIFGNPENSYNY